MTGPLLFKGVFIVNTLLIILDAALGYVVLPMLLRRRAEAAAPEEGAGPMRRLLSVMVAFYMLLNCVAYYGGHPVLLWCVTAFAGIDIIVQVVIMLRRLGREN